MGNLLSCGLGFVPSQHVVKLIHSNGLVEEFHRPVKARELTVDYPHHFIYNSEDLIFNFNHSHSRSRNHEDPGIASSLPSSLSDEEEMEIGQIYFLLPKKMFDLEYNSSALDLSAIATIASNAKKETAHRRRSGLHASMKQLAPLPQLPSAYPPSPRICINNKEVEAEEGKRIEFQTMKTMAIKDSPYPTPTSQSEMKGDEADAEQRVRFTKEFVQKLLAETKLKLQSAPKGTTIAMDPSTKAVLNDTNFFSRSSANTDTEAIGHGDAVKISAEMQTAYTRHILDKSFARLWRPPLDTIAEDHQILFLS